MAADRASRTGPADTADTARTTVAAVADPQPAMTTVAAAPAGAGDIGGGWCAGADAAGQLGAGFGRCGR